jgi:hypothetical protein
VGAHISHSKTTAILFHRKYSHPEKHIPKLYIDNKHIDYKETVKYLGITLDGKLSFTEYIEDKFASAKKSLVHYRASGQTSFLIWLSCMGEGYLIKGLPGESKKTPKTGLVTHVFVRSKCPTAGLDILAGLIHLELFLEKTLIQIYLQTQYLLPNWHSIDRGNLRGHLFWLKKLTLPLNLTNIKLQDKTNLITPPTLDCTCELGDFQTPDTNQQTTILIYMDESKT